MSKDNNNTTIFSTSFDDWKYWSEQYGKETDRGLAITSSAILDHLLASLIEKFLLDDKKASKELLSNSMAPLGTFASRIAISYSLGLITKEEKEDLNYIRKIRNKFAHKAIDISYETEQIKNMLGKLNIPKLISFAKIQKKPRTSRSIFIDAVSMLSTFIEIRKVNSVEHRTSAKKFIINPTR